MYLVGRSICCAGFLVAVKFPKSGEFKRRIRPNGPRMKKPKEQSPWAGEMKAEVRLALERQSLRYDGARSPSHGSGCEISRVSVLGCTPKSLAARPLCPRVTPRAWRTASLRKRVRLK